MRNLVYTISATCCIAALLTQPAHAATASKEESIGVGAGGVVGAFAGGPVGFIIGAAIGAKIGDTLDRQDDEIDTLTVSLETSRNRAAQLENEVATLGSSVDRVSAELAELRRVSRPELVELLREGIALDLKFRTDEHQLTVGAREYLADLATTLGVMPDIQVQLDGFADERGDEQYNQRLSEQRAQYVRDRLIDAGIDASRISVTAHGESPAADGTPDSYALERRVSVRLFIDESPAFASNPE